MSPKGKMKHACLLGLVRMTKSSMMQWSEVVVTSAFMLR